MVKNIFVGEVTFKIRSSSSSWNESFMTQEILDFEDFRKYNISRFIWILYDLELPENIWNLIIKHSKCVWYNFKTWKT